MAYRTGPAVSVHDVRNNHGEEADDLGEEAQWYTKSKPSEKDAARANSYAGKHRKYTWPRIATAGVAIGSWAMVGMVYLSILVRGGMYTEQSPLGIWAMGVLSVLAFFLLYAYGGKKSPFRAIGGLYITAMGATLVGFTSIVLVFLIGHAG